MNVVVPDKRIRNIPEVVLVRRWVSWGSGNLEGEGWVRGGTIQLANAELLNAELLNTELLNAELPNAELPNVELPNAENYPTSNITERRILQNG
jgi:hypothetical protein